MDVSRGAHNQMRSPGTVHDDRRSGAMLHSSCETTVKMVTCRLLM